VWKGINLRRLRCWKAERRFLLASQELIASKVSTNHSEVSAADIRVHSEVSSADIRVHSEVSAADIKSSQ
jgi:protein tyrosine/serine phosphatase